MEEVFDGDGWGNLTPNNFLIVDDSSSKRFHSNDEKSSSHGVPLPGAT